MGFGTESYRFAGVYVGARGLDQPVVDDRVEERLLMNIVDMHIHVVVLPSCRNVKVMWELRWLRLFSGRHLSIISPFPAKRLVVSLW